MNGKNYKVLLIDDEPFILEIIKAFLSEKGFEVSCAQDGQKGLELFYASHFDIVLTDLYMPVMDGLQVLENLSKKSPDTPVIVVSGAGGLQDSIEAIRLGAWDYIMKPLDFSVLTHQISKALERADLLKENKLYHESLEEQIAIRTSQLDKRTKELEETNLKLQEEIKNKEKVQKELQKAADQWQTTFDSMSDFISVHDLDFKIIRANKSLIDFLQINQEDIIGKKCCTIFHKSCNPIVSCPHRQTIKHNRTETTETNDEFGVPLLITTSPIFNDGKLIGSVHVAKDISEQRRIEEERQKTKNLESIASLAGGLAHDFNNLLAALVGYIDLARMESDPTSNIHEMLEHAKRVTKMASGLTQQLLTFSKGGFPILKDTSPVSLISECLEQAPSFGENIATTIKSPDDIWDIAADKGQIKIVIQNILYNAMESMTEGGALSIELKNIRKDQTNSPKFENGAVEICIEDNGRGISQENIKRIFDPYFTTKAMGADKGKGLGLAVCYSIIKKHGGEISVTSELNIGTKVSICLPASVSAKSEEWTHKITGEY